MRRFITLIQRDLAGFCAISSHLVEFKAERERDNGSVLSVRDRCERAIQRRNRANGVERALGYMTK